MKNYYWYVLVLLWAGACYGQHSNQELFLMGNQAYTAGDYRKALDLYQAMAYKGPAVWCNMGLCYAACTDDQAALHAWYQALRQAALRQAYTINTLIGNVESQHQDATVYFFDKLWARSLRPLVYGMPLALMQWLFIVLLVVAWGLIWHWHKRIIRGLFIVVVLVLITVGSVLYMRYWVTSRSYAVIESQTPLYVGPDTSYYQCDMVVYPQLVRVMSAQGIWMYISYDHKCGWVESKHLKLLCP